MTKGRARARVEEEEEEKRRRGKEEAPGRSVRRPGGDGSTRPTMPASRCPWTGSRCPWRLGRWIGDCKVLLLYLILFDSIA